MSDEQQEPYRALALYDGHPGVVDERSPESPGGIVARCPDTATAEKVARALNDIEGAVEALEWYANERNYVEGEWSEKSQRVVAHIDLDGGERARRVLGGR